MAWSFARETSLREIKIVSRNHRPRYLYLMACAAGILLTGTAWGQSAHSGPTPVSAAQRQFNSGDYAGVINSLRTAAAMTSSDAESHFWIARAYYEQHNFEQAIAHLGKAVQLAPSNSLYHQWLGRASGELADRERSFTLARKVKSEFETAVRLNPANISARRDLEEYCLDAPWIAGGNKDEAKAQVDAITSTDPIEGHLARAQYDLLALKKPDLADNEYHQAFDAKPKNTDPFLAAAEFYEKQNRPADLANVIDGAAKVSSSDPRLAFHRGVQRILAGKDLPQAEQYLKSYLASTPDRSDWPPHAAAREWLGRLYQIEGKHAEAAEQFRAALQLDPNRKEARTRLDQLEKAAH
jgi:tetratricopeptide (TPR) repeat protein